MDPDGIGTLHGILMRLGFIASDFSFRAVGEANVLIVTAPPQYLSVINDIASKFVPTKISDTTIVKIIPLKYAWAYDMTFNYANGSMSVPGVASMLQSIVTGEQVAAAMSPFNVNVGGSQQDIKYQKGIGILDDTPEYAKEMNKNAKEMNKGMQSMRAKEEEAKKADAGNGNEGNVADISGATLPGFITCDQRLNAIIIRDRRENMPFYEEIIGKLDVPCEVIKIDVAVVNVSSKASMSFGLKGIGLPGKSKKLSTSSLALSTIGAATIAPTGGSIDGICGILKNVDVNFALDAMADNGSVQTVAKPSVLTLDNVAAVLETDKVHYATVTGANSTNAYTQSATTQLKVVPHIIPGDVDGAGKRKMKLFVDISDGDFEKEGAVTQHSLNTQAVLYEEQSLVIGGYNTESNDQTDSGIPVLKDLPLVGAAFRHSVNSKDVKERVYVISPSVVEIRSDDHDYDKFLKPGRLTAESTLQPDEYKMTSKWKGAKKKASQGKRGPGG
jgi:type III secretion protein C